MRSIILSAIGFCAAVSAQSVVDKYVETELPIAKAGILANIGPSGSKSSGAAVCSISRIIRSYIDVQVILKAGVVIASPSATNPNYLYTWVRDSSLVFKYLVDL